MTHRRFKRFRSEVSAVYNPAQADAKVVIMKRHDDKPLAQLFKDEQADADRQAGRGAAPY